MEKSTLLKECFFCFFCKTYFDMKRIKNIIIICQFNHFVLSLQEMYIKILKKENRKKHNYVSLGKGM